MFSFSTISVFATVALSAFTSALPLAARDLPVVGSLPATGLTNALPVGGVVDTVSGLVPRDATKSLISILTDAKAQITPFTQQLQFVNKQNATVEHLTEPVNNIKSVLTSTTAQVKALAGLPVETILADVEGAVAVIAQTLATTLGDLLTAIFTALATVLAAVDADLVPTVTALLAAVVALVAELLTVVLGLVGGLVGGLLAALVPLLAGLLSGLVPTILTLNGATILSLLGL